MREKGGLDGEDVGMVWEDFRFVEEDVRSVGMFGLGWFMLMYCRLVSMSGWFGRMVV